MSGDRGRTALYAAELAAFDGTSYESTAPIGELQAIARRIAAAPWWPHGDVAVVVARADAASSSTRQRDGAAPVVRLARPQMTPATLVHELAHVLAGVAHGHGPRFCRAYLDLVGFLWGEEPASWLADALAAMGLEPGDRAWPRPPDHRAGGLAPVRAT